MMKTTNYYTSCYQTNRYQHKRERTGKPKKYNENAYKIKKSLFSAKSTAA